MIGNILFGMGILSVFAASFCLFMLTRNDRVYQHRMRVLSAINTYYAQNCHHGDTQEQLLAVAKQTTDYYDAYETVSYEAMMAKFWRPLNSFWKGTIIEELL